MIFITDGSGGGVVPKDGAGVAGIVAEVGVPSTPVTVASGAK